MKKILITCCLLLLFGGFLSAQTEKLPPLLKERKSGKVMFDRENAVEEVKRQRLAHSKAIEEEWRGKPCPTFSYTDLKEVVWSNQTIRGRVTLICFWDPASGPSMRQIPWLNKLSIRYPKANFIACTRKGAEQTLEAVERTSYLYPQLTNAMPLFQTLGVTIMPTFILIDKEGRVAAAITGTGDVAKHGVEAKIKENL